MEIVYVPSKHFYYRNGYEGNKYGEESYITNTVTIYI